MTYDPSEPTVAELIVADLKTTLESIEPPDYGSTLSGGDRVRVWDGDANAFTGAYSAMLVPQGERTIFELEPIRTSEALFSLVLAARGENALARIGRLRADVIVALVADGRDTRGGVALTTRIIASTTFDAPRGSGTREAQIDFAVEFSTLYDDPTKPY